MRTWEYKFIHTARSNDIVGALNEAGKLGWEAVDSMDVGHDYSILMKRPLGTDEELRIEVKPDAVARRLVPRIPADQRIAFDPVPTEKQRTFMANQPDHDWAGD